MLPLNVDFTDDFLSDDHTEFHLAVIAAMIKSGRFYRSAKGVLLFVPDPELPSDLVPISRPSEIESVLRAGLVIKLTGEAIKTDAMRALCLAILGHRWRIPPVSKAPLFAPLPGVRP